MTQLLNNFRKLPWLSEAHLQMLGLLSHHKLLTEGKAGLLLLLAP